MINLMPPGAPDEHLPKKGSHKKRASLSGSTRSSGSGATGDISAPALSDTSSSSFGCHDEDYGNGAQLLATSTTSLSVYATAATDYGTYAVDADVATPTESRDVDHDTIFPVITGGKIIPREEYGSDSDSRDSERNSEVSVASSLFNSVWGGSSGERSPVEKSVVPEYFGGRVGGNTEEGGGITNCQ